MLSLRAGRRRTRTSLAHRLPNSLIVNLTSFPPRFRTLHLTLESLLQQDVAPDRLILWIAHSDMAALPRRVTELTARGLEIRACDDLRSYKKLVPALDAFPGSFLATADDDVYYPPEWLRTLADGVEPEVPTIICHRVNRIAYAEDGSLKPYRQWADDVQDVAARRPSTDLVPIGVGGVLYPPNCLASETSRADLFGTLAPQGDDLWFFWMARRVGTRFKKVGDRFPRITWPGSQRDHLFARNEFGGNDRQIAQLIASFGQP